MNASTLNSAVLGGTAIAGAVTSLKLDAAPGVEAGAGFAGLTIGGAIARLPGPTGTAIAGFGIGMIAGAGMGALPFGAGNSKFQYRLLERPNTGLAVGGAVGAGLFGGLMFSATRKVAPSLALATIGALTVGSLGNMFSRTTSPSQANYKPMGPEEFTDRYLDAYGGGDQVVVDQVDPDDRYTAHHADFMGNHNGIATRAELLDAATDHAGSDGTLDDRDMQLLVAGSSSS